MIFDSLDNLGLYSDVHPAFADIEAFLAKTDLATLSVGKHPINSKGGYASVNEYNTRSIEESFIECHRKYIDVQIIAWGEEKIGVTNTQFCAEQPYDEGKDLQKLTGRVDYITLVPGFFAVFFTHDAHEPGVRSGTDVVAVKKIVFKVPV
ncbi:MAG: YhcH/YjgK/YiaL family protein [Desulfuromonadaceae bacterium]|nr:YhcH/YjgK/YiaL family protein [Desulfuromonadaceae bacterium]MDD5107019.1 YhcH/YjgK/YiaL family protein [Desulfuromonadaceae bacterium]